MAGEIQLNSTTMATESSGSITAELDTIRPNTNNGSLTLQGDSSGSGVTGLTIDSSGNATFAQTISGGTIGSSVVFPAGMITNYKASVYTVSAQQTGSTTFTAINGGTETNYTPTTSSGKVVYELTFTYAADNSNSNPLGFFYLDDGSEITRTRTEFYGHGMLAQAAFPYYTLRYVIPAYSGSKTLTAKFAHYGGTNTLRLHVAVYSGPGASGTLTTNVYRTVYTVSE